MSNAHVNGLVQLLGLARRRLAPFPEPVEVREARNAAVKAETARIIASMRAGTYSAGGEYLSAQRLRGTTQDATTANGGAR